MDNDSIYVSVSKEKWNKAKKIIHDRQEEIKAYIMNCFLRWFWRAERDFFYM
jgi:hypothetical protein